MARAPPSESLKPPMSAPAENARSPLPRRTSARVSSPGVASASRIAAITPALIALTGGLSSQTVRITRLGRFGLHDPHAERRVERLVGVAAVLTAERAGELQGLRQLLAAGETGSAMGVHLLDCNAGTGQEVAVRR